jgi:hypothetical protein
MCHSESESGWQQEITLADRTKKDAADIQFEKLQRAEDGKKAMSEYEAEAAAVRAKTERLRALRLARDAAQPAAAQKPSVAKKKSAKSVKGKSDTKLSDWLEEQDKSGRRS